MSGGRDEDEGLIEGLRRGAPGALANLYKVHASAIHGYALRLLGNAALAEEVTQDVFTSLWEKAANFDAGRGSLRAYLILLTRSRCIDQVRSEHSRARREARVSRADRLPPEAPDAELIEDDLLFDLRSRIAALPSDERLVIDLAYFGELSYREVAEVLELPEGTVKSRIRRGLDRLRP